jgi:DNA repair protein radA
MAKERTSMFFCSECGYDSAKWTGQCPVCKAWNTMIEEKVSKSSLPSKVLAKSIIENRPKLLKDIELDTSDRYSTYIDEFDRVLGGGIVIGSLVLVGGDPGIGKSTILLQVCKNLSNSGRKLIYVSGEESLKQIKLRANRIGLINTDMKLFCETDLSIIQQVILEERPEVVVIDSIQTMFTKDIGSAPGSVSQVRESTNVLMQLAKTNNIAIFIVGHVTKDGQVAGPRVLEHMVDTVLYFEGERTVSYRILRAVKNRFGSTNEIGVFEMRESGLDEVKNPSEYMLSGRPSNASGASVACLMEGSRPMLLEVQALITETVFGLPRRTAVGTDFNRVNLLMAVIEKRCGLQMSRYDAYINIAGGIKMNEPALDLSIIMSIVSGLKNRPIDDKTVIFGEVGLAGEVRAVSMAEYRIREAVKLGFTTCILPKISLEKLSDLSLTKKINLIGVQNIREAVGLI